MVGACMSTGVLSGVYAASIVRAGLIRATGTYITDESARA
jgi:hypothetical protein